MKRSLIKLAEDNNLPEHQYMDGETLDWIKKNKSNFVVTSKSDDNHDLVAKYLAQFTPSENWFLESREINTIHGMRHIMRVTANAVHYLLTLNGKLEDRDKSAIIAASLHDLRRKDDKGDVGHAKRAAEWFMKNINQVSDHYDISLSESQAKEIYFGIYFHEETYTNIVKDPNYISYKKIVDIVKTSDALDRYRLPKLKWWINDNLIKIVPSYKLKSFAYSLVVLSEQEYLKSGKNKESVMKSLKLLYNHG